MSIALGSTRSLQAELMGDPGVIYKECYHRSTREWGRFENCGIDKRATAEHQRKIAELLQKFEKESRPLTPEQNQQIDKHLDERFGVTSPNQRRDKLHAMLETAQQ